MDVHDYRVDPLTVEQLEARAVFYREKWGLRDTIRIDVYALLFSAVPEAFQRLNLKMVSRHAGFMGTRDAYATCKPRRIFYRDRLFAKLRMGDPRAAIIFLHELAHTLLHTGDAPKAWMTAGYEKIPYIEEERSAEWQATMFALCFKAPIHLAQDCNSPQDLMSRFGLGAEDAAVRYEIIRRRRPRSLPVALTAESVGHRPLANQFVEKCPDCGADMPLDFAQKQFCKVCQRYGDKWQDGDILGFDF